MIRGIWKENRYGDGDFSGRSAVLRRFSASCPAVGGGAAIFSRCYFVLDLVLRDRRRFGKPLDSAGRKSGPSGHRAIPEPRIGRFRNHGAAIPEPRKDRCAAQGGLPSVGVTETTIENGTTVSWGRADQAGRGRHRRPAATGDFFICDLPWASAQGRHGVDGASAVHAGDPARPAHPALRARDGDDRGDALGQGARHDPRQGRADLLRQPADGGAERRAADRRRCCTSTRTTCWSATNRETSRRRLPAAARGARAAVGDADRHQHRDRRRREHPRLRADRRLGDPAQGPRRADDPRHGDAVGLDVPLGGRRSRC